MTDWVGAYDLSTLTRKPDVLEADAREILASLGHHDPAAYSTHGFVLSPEGQIGFWYRQAPEFLTATRLPMWWPAAGWRVTPDNPPPIEPGMVGVRLAPDGTLLSFAAVLDDDEFERSADSSQVEPTVLPWNRLFPPSLIPVDLGRIDQVPRDQLPPPPLVPHDALASWLVTQPDTGVRYRFTAAALRNTPVYYEVAPADAPVAAAWTSPTSPAALAALHLCLLIAGALIAAHNIRVGRVDMRGSVRFALACLAVDLLACVFGLRHADNPLAELPLARDALFHSVGRAFRFWLYYVALEPYVRRFWPHVLSGWSRLIAGRLTDALVARDILIGAAAALIIGLANLALQSVGVRESLGLEGDQLFVDALLAPRYPAAGVVLALSTALTLGFYFLLFLLIMRGLLRNPALAIVAAAAVIAVVGRGQAPLPVMVANFVFAVLWMIVLTRFGVVALLSLILVVNAIRAMPLSADLAAWYAQPGLLVMGFIVALALYAYACSTLTGRRLLPDAPPVPHAPH